MLDSIELYFWWVGLQLLNKFMLLVRLFFNTFKTFSAGVPVSFFTVVSITHFMPASTASMSSLCSSPRWVFTHFCAYFGATRAAKYGSFLWATVRNSLSRRTATIACDAWHLVSVNEKENSKSMNVPKCVCFVIDIKENVYYRSPSSVSIAPHFLHLAIFFSNLFLLKPHNSVWPLDTATSLNTLTRHSYWSMTTVKLTASPAATASRDSINEMSVWT